MCTHTQMGILTPYGHTGTKHTLRDTHSLTPPQAYTHTHLGVIRFKYWDRLSTQLFSPGRVVSRPLELIFRPRRPKGNDVSQRGGRIGFLSSTGHFLPFVDSLTLSTPLCVNATWSWSPGILPVACLPTPFFLTTYWKSKNSLLD